MRAAIYRRFGPPEVVGIEEVPTPSPGRDEVLIRVCASTVSAADYRARTRIVPSGLAVPVALALGVFRPRRSILGMDVAGVVEAVGADVTTFAPGDEIVAMLGARFGGHAQYVCIPASGAITAKPDNMTFAEAVALVFGGVTAQAFLDRASVGPGARVLVNGASGAVGTAAIQLATVRGAHVTAVCSSANHDLVTTLGADEVIDYAVADFTQEARCDVIMDCVGNAPFRRVEGALNDGGALLLVVADLKAILGASRASRTSGKVVTAQEVVYTAEALSRLVLLAEAGKFRPVIDRRYDFADIVDAHRYVDTGRKKGSVVLDIPSPTSSSQEGPQ
ncbi:MAG: NAD(P)-dependent alcohol dehydrogenase [Salinibacterium sp.]|nr:NAD(P)-dependent alcohol dehydrogenase [Salinibacterium sp.]